MLVRMWEKELFHSVDGNLNEYSYCAARTEVQKTKNRVTMGSSSTMPWCIPKRIEVSRLQWHLRTHVYWNTVQPDAHQYMNRERKHGVYIHDGEFLSHKEEWNCSICRWKLDRTGNDLVEWIKQDSPRPVLYVFPDP